MCTCDGGIFRADVFSSIACGCSVSTVKIPVPLANLYRLQPVATDSKKTMHSVSTVLVGDGCCASVSVHMPV